VKPSRTRRPPEDSASTLDEALPVYLHSGHTGLATRLRVGLVRDPSSPPYWTRYERFLRNNGFAYGFIDIHRSGWLAQAESYDVVVWRPRPTPWQLAEAREKIHLLERHTGTAVYPTLDEILFYENKLLQWELMRRHGLPVIDTFVSFERDEALAWLDDGADYPLVAKPRVSSSSKGVELLRSPAAARRLVRQVFSTRGRRGVWRPERQHGYVLLQRFVPPQGHEVRVMVVDREHIFGYMREIPAGDFRASGRGRSIKRGLPEEAVAVAVEAWERLDFTSLVVDFLYDRADGRFRIVEATLFPGIWSCRQLCDHGTPGRYLWPSGAASPSFAKGRWWLQELCLRRFLERRFGSGDGA